MDQLTQLKAMTVVSADTADLDAFGELQPHDATTNPTFIALVAPDPRYAALVEEALQYSKANSSSETERLELALDRLCVNVGMQISKLVPGYVSTEVDARLSFDEPETLRRAKRIIAMYEAGGLMRDHVLIKVAGTWEGIQAAKALEAEGIRTNVTLVFSMAQAVAAAQGNCTLISPFVGRMLDWHTKAGSVGDEDPGVTSVKEIYAYYKKQGHETIVMGASFRNIDEIYSLAGVDRLTVSPKFLEKLRNTHEPLPRKLHPAQAAGAGGDRLPELDAAAFRWMLNEDACATEKLSEGIRAFGKDTDKVEAYLTSLPLWKA